MLFEKKDGLFIGRFAHLLVHRHVVHGFSTRRGGVSPAPYDSLNLGLNTEDGFDCVRENRKRFFAAVRLDEKRTVILKQVHGDRVHVAASPGTVQDADTVVTDRKGLILSIQVADCLSVFLVDPSRQAVGLVHAGWRGTVKRISQKTVHAMERSFKTDPANLLAFFGPSIGPCCYTIGKDTAVQFDPKYILEDKLDLWECNADQLAEAGVKKENIVQSRLCTACHPEWFYSHRASGGKTGRMLGVLGIQESSST